MASMYGLYVWFLCMVSMYGLYVWSLCMVSMYGLYVWSLCMVSMYGLYVWSLCMVSMYGLYVWSLCMVSMYGLYVWSLCMVSMYGLPLINTDFDVSCVLYILYYVVNQIFITVDVVPCLLSNKTCIMDRIKFYIHVMKWWKVSRWYSQCEI